MGDAPQEPARRSWGGPGQRIRLSSHRCRGAGANTTRYDLAASKRATAKVYTAASESDSAGALGIGPAKRAAFHRASNTHGFASQDLGEAADGVRAVAAVGGPVHGQKHARR